MATAGSGSLVAARAVGALGDAIGAGLTAFGDRMDQMVAHAERQQAAAAEWEAAARLVIEVNSRIEVLRSRDDLPAGVVDAVPATLVAGPQSAAELRAWSESARRAVIAAERDRIRRASEAVLLLQDAATSPRVVDASEALASYRMHLAAASVRQRPALAGATEAVGRIVGRFAVDAVPADRAAVLAAASEVVSDHPGVDQGTRLNELRLRVQRANERSIARRQDALTAATMLQALAEVSGSEGEALERSCPTSWPDGQSSPRICGGGPSRPWRGSGRFRSVPTSGIR